MELNSAEQEKRLKYLDLVANAVILQNIVDLLLAIQTLIAEGMKIDRAALKTLSPYITRHLNVMVIRSSMDAADGTK